MINKYNKKGVLTDKQLKAIPIIISSNTIVKGLESAKVNKATFYDKWMKTPLFVKEYEKQRSEMYCKLKDISFDSLKSYYIKALDALARLIDNSLEEHIIKDCAKELLKAITDLKKIESQSLTTNLAIKELEKEEQKSGKLNVVNFAKKD